MNLYAIIYKITNKNINNFNVVNLIMSQTIEDNNLATIISQVQNRYVCTSNLDFIQENQKILLVEMKTLFNTYNITKYNFADFEIKIESIKLVYENVIVLN